MSPSLYNENTYRNFTEHSLLPFGIELVSISFGFIVYFLIVNFSKKRTETKAKVKKAKAKESSFNFCL